MLVPKKLIVATMDERITMSHKNIKMLYIVELFFNNLGNFKTRNYASDLLS